MNADYCSLFTLFRRTRRRLITKRQILYKSGAAQKGAGQINSWFIDARTRTPRQTKLTTWRRDASTTDASETEKWCLMVNQGLGCLLLLPCVGTILLLPLKFLNQINLAAISCNYKLSLNILLYFYNWKYLHELMKMSTIYFFLLNSAIKKNFVYSLVSLWPKVNSLWRRPQFFYHKYKQILQI